MTAQPVESVATALTVDVLPVSTVHGLHDAFTDSSCTGAGGGGGGGGGADGGVVPTPPASGPIG